MLILSDKNVRFQAAVMVLILLLLIIVSQIYVMRMAGDYKRNMIAHDAEIAGYLLGNGLDEQLIKMAFTTQKTAVDQKMGTAVLKDSGYDENTSNFLLPEITGFQQKYAFIALALSLSFSLLLLATFSFFLWKQDKQLNDAGKKIQGFMDGDVSIRLEDSYEDHLSRLFAKINTMATALTAHMEKEKNNRLFLKETISDISHQLKTPLAALQMYNEIILDEKPGNAVVVDFSQKSQRELLRMENLIQNLLKLAKLDAGTIALEKNTHDLNEFLEKCRSAFMTRAALENKKISLVCDRSIRLCFDEIWLNEALGNIIKNALDHTKAMDSIAICGVENRLAIEITVKDNGSGIHPDDIYHIFERFYRSRYSKDQQGIGIGLALSKSIIEKHGGTITVQSELGEGTVFHLIFPKLTNL
ncbi:sensor histidine kinase [Acetobacterium tundrae]|uniref:histidine kinase n=1 Tax=Acetobacterium tundrae TaxID=132932 RepID=A0ABR6WHX8_9FIRM|nr:HAMP domain-containing sensor histidine kinase [Acetobacterium tundrae]MBC3796100.1 sensor histidine kinase [Acetobacterium tundrae]